MGYALPPGTIVAAQGWSMHRDASVFTSPNTFLPERWLESAENAEDLFKMAQYLMPFGMGTRVCGGQNLAQMMLRIAVAAVARNFDVVAPAETNERSMEIKDSFVRIDLYTRKTWLIVYCSCSAGYLPRFDGM
jgi:cytochrome P450